MERTFSNFSIETRLEKPVTVDNFFKYSIDIRDTEGKFVNSIKASELSLTFAENFIYGDENTVKQTIKQIINNRLFWIEQLQSILTP